MTTSLMFGWVITVGSVLGLLVLLLWLRIRGPRELAAEDAGAETFSLEFYGPLSRLLSSDDYDFLSKQPGYQASMGARWRKQRERIFRLYLTELKHDFRRLHAQARLAVAESPAESAELVSALIRQQMQFWRTMTMLEIRLALRPLGIGSVDLRPLLELLDAMRLNLASFESAPASA